MTTMTRTRPLPRRFGLAALVLMLLASAACVAQTGDHRPAARPPGFVVSYAGADSRLAGLSDEEDDEQLRDWVRLGLAAELGLDTARLAGSLYDTFPVRDDGLADLGRQPVGPGRFLFADGVLHLLVPRDDPHRDRTIGLLLDQYRTDAGTDPARVRPHFYTIDRDTRTVRVDSGTEAATGEFRKAHGYVRMRIDEAGGLTEFLNATRALSTMDVVGDQVWASGWTWPARDGQRLSRADVAVLQRGYDSADGPPGFSLDAGPVRTAADLAAIAPDLDPGLIDGLLHDAWPGPDFRSAAEFASAVDDAVFGETPEAELAASGLPTDRTQLWALHTYLRSGSAYGQARYDGGLEGTEVGMTLFYTDYVTKDWVNGVGKGVPADAVAGFEPDTSATTPWSQCENLDEGSTSTSGRLWFGQNDAAYSTRPGTISIGAQPTRLFTRSDGSSGSEVEADYVAGRGLRWWDRHFQAVADYEPQYQRLDQIMRWSAALDWLGRDKASLLPAPAEAGSDDLRFADWYRARTDLRERGPIRFVDPPAAKEESVLTVPARRHEDCGLLAVNGGVSLANLTERQALSGVDFGADLPAGVRRAGLYDTKSASDPKTGDGSMKQLSIDDAGTASSFLSHEISHPDRATARIEVTASPSGVNPLGTLKQWRAGDAPRSATVEVRAGHGEVAQDLRLDGHDVGGIRATKLGNVVTLQWRRGIVDRVKNVLESLQRRVSQGRGEAPVDGVLYGVRRPGGDLAYRVGDAGEPWLSVTSHAPAGDGMAFRLGAPSARGVRHLYGKLVPGPRFPAGESLTVTPATPDSAAVATVEAGPPRGTAVTVTTRDGRKSTVRYDGNAVRAPPGDPVLGVGASVAAAALERNFPVVAKAMREAAEADDGLARGVLLGEDGAALVGADGIRLLEPGDPWTAAVAGATAPKSAPPLFGQVGDHLVSQANVPVRPVPGTGTGRLLGDVLAGDEVVLLDDGLRTSLVLDDGPVLADTLPGEHEVVVVEAELADGYAFPAALPDVWVAGGHKWWRVADTPGASGGGGGSGGHGGAKPVVPRVVLVCEPDEDGDTDDDRECAL